ncbi:MAG: hypothetical protein AAF772_21535, partial [Acidobacteriota bacterium]
SCGRALAEGAQHGWTARAFGPALRDRALALAPRLAADAIADAGDPPRGAQLRIDLDAARDEIARIASMLEATPFTPVDEAARWAALRDVVAPLAARMATVTAAVDARAQTAVVRLHPRAAASSRQEDPP